MDFTTASGTQEYSGSESTIRPKSLDADGWQGTATLQTNTKPGGDFTFPLALNLTNLDMNCAAEKRCDFFQFDFDLLLYFDELTFDAEKTPLALSLTGASPNCAFGFYVKTSLGPAYNFET